MLMALLHGKLSRDQENMEDILTSNVFGLLKYLPPEAGLIPFLQKACTPGGTYPLADLPLGIEAEYKFWPWLVEAECDPCEPDVLIQMKPPNDKRILVLIEAKYRSGKSSEEENSSPDEISRNREESAVLTSAQLKDQLSREWENLRSLADKESAQPVLVYLTADVGCPTEEIEDSQKALESRKKERGTICWLSWRHLPSLIINSEHEMLRDLGAALCRMNLTFFEGFSKIASPVPIRWTFAGRQVKFNWGSSFALGHLQWEFRK